MEIIKSKRGSDKLCSDGYSYTKKKTTKSTIRWECSKRRTLRCNGTVTTDLNVRDIQSSTTHNHPSDYMEIEGLKVRQEILDNVANSRGTPSQIVCDQLVQHAVEVRVATGKVETIKRAVRRRKRGNTPAEPESISFIPELPEEFTTTGGAENLPFLVYDTYSEGEDNSNRMIVFATERGLQCLSDSEHWFMDGTFGIAPRQFQQLFVIRAIHLDVATTCAYAFLPHKDQTSYEEVFTAILNACDEYNLIPNPVTVSCDYEMAIHNAVRNMFGDHIRVQACFYHLTQSTWRRIQELGLSVRYKEEEDVKLYCGMLDALAFLPVDAVKDGMRYLRESIPDGLYDLVEYFDCTYVSGPFSAVRGAGGMIRMRRTGTPRFSLDTWNVHAVTLEDGHRTNNICESWNNAFSCMVGHKNPGLWHVIQCVQKDQLMALTDLHRAEMGEPVSKRVRRDSERLQKRLKTLCQQFETGRKPVGDFLRAVGQCIRF